MILYRYLFYRFYIFFEYINGEISSFLAIMGLCWLLSFNIMTIHTYFFYQGYDWATNGVKYIDGTLAIIIFLTHYIYFGYRSDKIIKFFENKKIVNDFVGIGVAAAYAIVSVYLFYVYTIPSMAGMLQ